MPLGHSRNVARVRIQILPLLVGVVAAATLSGCGSDGATTPQNEPSSATTAANSTRSLADPCALPDSTLTSAGLVTEDPIPRPVGAEFAGWKGCIWKTDAGWFDTGIYTGPISVADFEADPKFHDYTLTGPITVGDKQATGFADSLDPERHQRCYIGVDMPYGMALFTARIPYVRDGEQSPGDPCAEVRTISADVLKSSPAL